MADMIITHASGGIVWLGHVSLNTMNIYAVVDLEMKAKAVAFRIIWRSVSEIFGVVSDLLYDPRQTGA
jgi:hypothetical protein